MRLIEWVSLPDDLGWYSNSGEREQDDDEEPQARHLPIGDRLVDQLELLEQDAVPQQLQNPAEEEEGSDADTREHASQ